MRGQISKQRGCQLIANPKVPKISDILISEFLSIDREEIPVSAVFVTVIVDLCDQGG